MAEIHAATAFLVEHPFLGVWVVAAVTATGITALPWTDRELRASARALDALVPSRAVRAMLRAIAQG